ncbi:MAG: SIMPL domain-containing protein [Bdellovibrionales bacterium]|nr:SIMPL domain-containing protein [Oligoflexia bacterium]
MKLSYFLILSVFFVSSAFSEETKKVSVSGQCTAEVAPDRGSVNFVAERVEKDAATAIKKATELHESLRAEFKKLNLKDLEFSSSEYSVQERKEWEKNKNVSKGFAARLGLKAVTHTIADLGRLMEIAGRLGVTETSGLTTYVSDAKWMEEKNRCLDAAAKNAEVKAQALVKSLHAKLGKVLQITETSSVAPGPVQPMFMERAMMKSDARGSAPTPTIEGQKQSLVQDVQVVFLIE